MVIDVDSPDRGIAGHVIAAVDVVAPAQYVRTAYLTRRISHIGGDLPGR